MSWRPLKAFDRARLSPARVQAHFAAQWLARVARAYVPARPDDGHTNFGWDDRFGGFTTHALPSGARLGLKVADLRLVFFDATGEIADPLALDGRRDADARAWLGRHAAANGYDPATLDARLPYDMPAHPIAAGGAYAGFAEDRFGRLAPGQRADFIIVDRDPLLASPSDLRATKVEQTWIGGHKVWSAK